ncbi:hypothetical protein M2375_003006 [Comamonas sp. BIGb0152]|nr:hypothetical protein [Comamonas sp. BIGb0152]
MHYSAGFPQYEALCHHLENYLCNLPSSSAARAMARPRHHRKSPPKWAFLA